jgi:hypothetical protein
VIDASNSETDFLTFEFPGDQVSPEIIDTDSHTINITVDFNTDVTSLAATFTLSPQASAEVGGVPQTSGTTTNDFTGPVVYSVIAGDGTVQDWTIIVSLAANDETDFLTYGLPGQTGPAEINIGNHTINVEMPYNADVSDLIATFGLSPQATADIGGLSQQSGVTSNDFTAPVIYTITAGDGITVQDWSVTVSFAPNTETDILTYSIDGFIGTVDTIAHMVSVIVPYGTDVSNLIANFTLSEEAIASVSGSVQESGVSSLNFSSPVTYELTAGDGITTQNWMVSVDVESNTETDFILFSFPEQADTANIDINNHTINIQVVYGTPLNNLTASFELSYGATTGIGGVLQTSGATANDFTNPVTYRVLAEDGSTFQDWTINVSIALNSETDILTFSIPDELGSSVVNSGSHSVAVVVPYSTDITALVPTFTLSSGATANIDGVLQTSGVTSNDYSNDVIYTIVAENGIDTQDWIVQVLVAPNTSTGILLYSFNEISRPTVINNNDHTIEVEVVYGTDLTDLVATFTLSEGATVSVDGVSQTSGITSNDFTNPVTYTVTAQDGFTSQDWIINVSLAQNTEADILDFSFPEQVSPANIDPEGHRIDIVVAYDTDLTNLIADFTLSDNATARIGTIQQTSGVTSNDFTNAVTYIVTSEDGLNQIPWLVVVELAPNSNTFFLSYGLNEEIVSIKIDTAAHEIEISVEYGTNLTNLIAYFSLPPQAIVLVGPVIQESGVTANDFSNPVVYTIQAGDNSIQEWTVSVTYATPINETDFLSFSFEQQAYEPNVDTVNHRIVVFIEEDAEIDRLIASFTLSRGANAYIDTVLQESGITVNDFSDTVTYTVIAQDNITQQDWIVVVDYEFGFQYFDEPIEYPVSQPSIKASVRLPIDHYYNNILFYYKKFEDQQWSSVGAIEDQGVYSVEITRDMVGNLGMYYYFNASDTVGSNQSLPYRQLVLHYDTDYPEIPNLKFGETVNHYQIVAIPYELQDSNVEAVFDELEAYDIKYWRLFHYNGISNIEYNQGFTTMEPGVGYWLIARQENNITTGESRTVRIDSTNGFQIDLEPGWNHIGNPFDMDISWDRIITQNGNLNVGRIRLFDQDSLSEGDIIPRFRGGFVFLDGRQPLTVNLKPVVINPYARKQPYMDPAQLNPIDHQNWIADMSISNGIVTNSLPGIGMHPEAHDGKDRFDKVLLPVPEQIIPFQLVFNHPDEKYKKFSMDVVQTKDHYIWEFEVKNFAQSQNLTFYWNNRYFGDNEKQLFLVHEGSGKVVNMKEANSYIFKATGLDQFRIVFGDREFVNKELIPKSTTLGDGYPNPFRDQLKIPFTLPENNSNYFVNISIYDIKGNLVKQLTNERYTAGYYTVNWNSTENTGILSGSIYIIRMTVKSNMVNTVIHKKILRY